MEPNLPEGVGRAVRPLFDAVPIDGALSRLVVTSSGGGHVELFDSILRDPAIQDAPELMAGLWLYLDELDRSHRLSQKIESPTGSFWHAIMHRREGDFSNSKHWYSRAGEHPVMQRLDSFSGPDFVDRVERAHDLGDDAPELVSGQRREWMTLFEWCALNKSPR